MPSFPQAVHTLLCSTVSNALFEVDGCDLEWPVPLSGSLSELVERELSGLSWSSPV